MSSRTLFNFVLPLAVASSLSVSSPLTANDSVEASDTLVVTAARAEQSQSDSLSSVTVISRAEIERSQAPDLIELLRMEAGLDISRTGGPGGQTSVFLRGSNSNHTLVLIDGVRVAAAGTGAFTWEILDPSLIERIEIVRGPRAARWGSDAIGGVIQIFTRQPERWSARLAAGSYGDRSLSVTGGNDQFSISASRREADGFSAQNPNGFAFDPDDDGLERTGAAGTARFDLGAGQLDLHARIDQGEIEFDQGESDFRNYSAGLDYQVELSSDWRLGAQLATLGDRLETSTAFGESELTTDRIQAAVQFEHMLTPELRWITGVDAWDEDGESRGSWEDDRNNLGAWTGIDGRHGQLDYDAGLRIDEDSEFGSEVTGSLGLGWNLSDTIRLTASAGRGFRAPTFNQLFSPGFFGSFAGNPDLDPETSRSIELGLQLQPSAGQRLTLNLFDTAIDDLIDFAGVDFQAINIRRADIRGAELIHEYQSGNWRLNSQGSWLDSEDRESGQELLRRARYKASSRLDYLFENGAWVGTELVHVGQRQDIAQQTLASYTLLNVSAGMNLADQWRIEGRVDNLADRSYEPLIGFNAPERAIYVGLNWSR
ncbi:MAG: TonB-dependent receptor [Pseudomonadota bacterium]